MKVIKQVFIARRDLRLNPDILYLFGDNLVHKGHGGQAAEMRGEPNALGIPTKKAPSRDPTAFFTDDEYSSNCEHIDWAFRQIPPDTELIVIPADGLGTGLALLDLQAPKTFRYLQSKLNSLNSDEN